MYVRSYEMIFSIALANYNHYVMTNYIIIIYQHCNRVRSICISGSNGSLFSESLGLGLNNIVNILLEIRLGSW